MTKTKTLTPEQRLSAIALETLLRLRDSLRAEKIESEFITAFSNWARGTNK